MTADRLAACHPARALLAAAVLALCCALVACGDDDPTGPLAPGAGASSPDSLVTLFATALERMELHGYAALLHRDWEFVPKPEDLAELGLVAGETFDRTDELQIASNIFSGAAGSDGAPGIHSILVLAMDRVGEWQPTTNPLYPGTEEGLYHVELQFRHADGYFSVLGQQRFWALNAAEPGATARWVLRTQQDFTGIWKVETISWGRLKSSYR